MANREKGEGALVVDGKTYTLVLNTFAWAQTQDALTRISINPDVQPLEEIELKIVQQSALHMIALLWAMLQTHHSEQFRRVQDAGALIDCGGMAVSIAMLKAMGLSAPDPADVKEIEEGRKKNPQTAQAMPAGTGDGSISTPAASA